MSDQCITGVFNSPIGPLTLSGGNLYEVDATPFGTYDGEFTADWTSYDNVTSVVPVVLTSEDCEAADLDFVVYADCTLVLITGTTICSAYTAVAAIIDSLAPFTATCDTTLGECTCICPDSNITLPEYVVPEESTVPSSSQSEANTNTETVDGYPISFNSGSSNSAVLSALVIAAFAAAEL